MAPNGESLELSYVLVTDTIETVAGVLAHLERQTAASAIELVLISPNTIDADDPALDRGLGAVRIVRCEEPIDLSSARALGVRSATAPVVFIGETHSFPEPEMVERLLAAMQGTWDAVVPAVINAHPDSVRSWAVHLMDYGAWSPHRPAEATDEPLVYNAAFRRDALLALGDQLADAISAIDDDLWRSFGAAGRRARFEPTARIRHLSVSRPAALIRERILCGLRFGEFRARRWPWWRRLLYAAGSPLVPFVLYWRKRQAVLRHRAAERFPASMSLWMIWLLTLRAAGEGFGYLGFGVHADSAETEIEIHRTRYVKGSG